MFGSIACLAGPVVYLGVLTFKASGMSKIYSRSKSRYSCIGSVVIAL